MPTSVVVGRTLADGVVEVRDRASGEKTEVGVDVVANHVVALVKGVTGLELPLLTIALLVAASFLAGSVDSIVGGGGLIQLPSLLIGLPADTPVPTIAGTNKLPQRNGHGGRGHRLLRRVRIPWAALLP